MLLRRFLALAFISLVLTGWLGAAGFPELRVRDQFDPRASLPFEPAVRSGRLPNGMHYYLMRHGRPEGRALLRLAVDAGSALEDDDQRGLAHFVEHMAFNGTADFGESELVAYLESLGNRFGPDVNAFTSFEETVYRLEVPTASLDDLASGFHVMEQWAHAVTFDARAVDRERSIIVEEWRSGRSASRRMFEQHVPVLLGGSRYADRLPIGEMDVVRNAPRDRLVDFYRRWYRPDNMAFVAVGDFDLDVVEQLVLRYFGTLQRPAEPLHKPHFELSAPVARRISVATDAETEGTTVTFYAAEPPHPFQTVGDYRAMLERSLFTAIVNERLRDAARDPAAAFFQAGLGWTQFVRPAIMSVATVTPKPGRAPEATTALVVELRRAVQYGVTGAELERAKARFMQSIENSRANQAARHSQELADELVRHYLQGEPVPGIEFEYELYRRLLPEIGVASVSAVAGEFARITEAVVLVNGPADGTTPDSARVAAAIEAAERVAVAPPAEETAAERLLADHPQPGSIVERIEHPAVEVREYRLSNGARVLLKPTTFKADEIVLSAVSPGGLSLVETADITAAKMATAVAATSGIGELGAVELERFLAGRGVRVGASIGLNAEGIEGTSRVADLEVLFQWVHALFTEPRFDPAVLEVQRARTLQQIAEAESSPRGRFGRELQRLTAFGDARLEALERTEVAAVTIEDIERVYRQRFANAADFVFVITGSFEDTDIDALVERYLASAPGDAQRRERARDNGYAPPTAASNHVVHAGNDPVSQVVFVFAGDYAWSQRENQALNMLSDVLDIRLREVIREEAGGAYGVGAAAGRARDPRPTYIAQIAFGCDPERVEELSAAALAVVEELRAAPPAPSYLQRVRAQQLQQFRRLQTENGWWASALLFAARHDRDLSTVLDAPGLIESIDAAELQRLAQDYLDPSRVLRAVLAPAP